MAAKEARAAGLHWAFAPMVDIARDARWGRIMESAGEDPFLGETMAAAQVRGFQGEFIGSPDHIISSVKHFAGYGAAEGGRDYDSSDISDELLYNVYLRPYKAGVDAGTANIMSAYMDLNGVPATGNSWLLQDVLRKEWGFKGFVVSDWDSVKSLETHGFAADPADAALRAANAGVNMEMTSSNYREHLADAVKRGGITEAQIDALVRPLLATKYRLGLFQQPYVDLERFRSVTGAPEQRVAVREAAEQTAVLLRNENGTLPLRKDLRSIAVIGPLADSKLDTLGSWAIHGDRENVITVAQGIREHLPGANVSVSMGVEIERGSPTIFDDQVPLTKVTLTTQAKREAEFQHALNLVRAADVTILVLGEAQTMNGERASRASLSLPGEQQRLLEAAAALGKPIVLVLMTGRPLDITWASTHVPAILNAWYAGSEGGRSVANLLFGDANPSGHLPVSWPRSAGQEPLFYNTNLTQIPEDSQGRYWDLQSTPLYPFGYGLSYSSFDLRDLRTDRSSLRAGERLRVRLTLQNVSSVAGAQVIQIYTHQRAGSASRPVICALGPQMQKLGVDIFFGTLERGNPALFEAVYADPVAGPFLKGIGVQWAGKNALLALQKRFPDLPIYGSEQECGDGTNTWSYAGYCWDLMKDYFRNGARAYMYWNIALEEGGKSTWGWSQNSLVLVDTGAGTFRYTPDYYLLKHLSHYIDTGAALVPTSGTCDNVLAFRNPDAKLVFVIRNELSHSQAVQVQVIDQTFSLELAPDSISTVTVTQTRA